MPIITISRGSMSGGQALAESLAGAFGSPCVAREVVVEAAAKLGVPEKVLSEKLERGPRVWDRLTLARRTYVVAVQEALAEHAVKGDLVYHGRAGHLLLRGMPAVLRVRLIAPMEMRVRAVIEREGVSPPEAEQVIQQRDEARRRWTQAMYGVDIGDPRLYDLVVNLEGMSIRSASAVVMAAAQRPEYAITDEVRGKLQDFLLACRVKVALATRPASRGLDLEATALKGVVTIRGEVPKAEMLTHASTRWEQELMEIAQSVQGVEAVHLDVRTFDLYH